METTIENKVKEAIEKAGINNVNVYALVYEEDGETVVAVDARGARRERLLEPVKRTMAGLGIVDLEPLSEDVVPKSEGVRVYGIAA